MMGYTYIPQLEELRKHGLEMLVLCNSIGATSGQWRGGPVAARTVSTEPGD